MIERLFSIAAFSFRQWIRSRIYLNLLVAGITLILAALSLDRLSGGEGPRALTDLGLAFISLVVAVLAGTTTLLHVSREIEEQRIHLYLARPVSRGTLLIGRFLASSLLVIVANAVLGGALALLTQALGGPGGRVFGAALFASFEGFIVAALALAFGVASSTTLSALLTLTLFVLGRTCGVLRTLLDAGKLEGPLEPLLEGAYRLLPHLYRFDATLFAQGRDDMSLSEWLSATGYGAAYIVAVLAIAVFRFERRDFP